jgi:DNA-binding response OmpR family regulator
VTRSGGGTGPGDGGRSADPEPDEADRAADPEPDGEGRGDGGKAGDGATGAGDGGQPVVLVAEDERGLADLFASWLADDYEVRVAYDGESALERYDASVDVVLLDRKMPGSSGDEVLRRVREDDGDCGVAMVTAVDPDFDVVDMAFDEYVVKPVDRGELFDLVETLRRRTDLAADLRRHYRLAATLSALEAHKTAEELAESEAYARLEAELAAIDGTLSAAVDEMSSADVGAVLRSEAPER